MEEEEEVGPGPALPCTQSGRSRFQVEYTGRQEGHIMFRPWNHRHQNHNANQDKNQDLDPNQHREEYDQDQNQHWNENQN